MRWDADAKIEALFIMRDSHCYPLVNQCGRLPTGVIELSIKMGRRQRVVSEEAGFAICFQELTPRNVGVFQPHEIRGRLVGDLEFFRVIP